MLKAVYPKEMPEEIKKYFNWFLAANGWNPFTGVTCFRCKQRIEIMEVYRCYDCDGSFHKKCLISHCENEKVVFMNKKYYTISNKEWDIDDIVSEEILILVCPENFEPKTMSLVTEFLSEFGFTHYIEKDNICIPLNNTFTAIAIITDISYILSRQKDDEQRNLLIKWLKEKYNVEVIISEIL